MAAPAEMAAFVRTATRGGFSAAARDLSLTPSGVSKLVTRLEARLGVRLLKRTTRSLSLTPEGAIYFERAKRIVAEIEDAENEIAGFRKRPKGRFRISVLVAFGRCQLLQALPRFLERHPEIQLEVELSDSRVDLVDTGVDLAIRLGVLDDSSLVARKICDVERLVCASPAYLARRGTPRRPEDLLQHNCLWVTSAPVHRRWPFATRQGRKSILVSGNVAAGDGEALLELALQGLGIVRLADFLVGPEIAKGRLLPLLADVHDPTPIPLQAVHAYGRQRSPKVAAMIEFLLESFGGAPWRRR
jgi:DNA-binding transcriptional LysR family regulator